MKPTSSFVNACCQAYHHDERRSSHFVAWMTGSTFVILPCEIGERSLEGCSPSYVAIVPYRLRVFPATARVAIMEDGHLVELHDAKLEVGSNFSIDYHGEWVQDFTMIKVSH